MGTAMEATFGWYYELGWTSRADVTVELTY